MRKRATLFGLIFFSILGGAMTAAADTAPAADEEQTIGRTPPRLSFLDGQVSFWRTGAEDWTQASINTALAPGDQLYIQGSGNLELQIGARAYVRGGRDAQFELATQEPDFLRFKVNGGRMAFDLRSLAPGRSVEVDTPHGAFIMNHEGYYRLEVSDARTTFTTRRTGRASVAAAHGDAFPMESDESVSVEDASGKALAFQAAPPVDAWDTWNYDRTDALLEAGSTRYVAPDTYGTAELDRYGSWRVLPTYGPVWVPAGVAPGWAPYSTGSWMYDPYYGWTWVDVAPWGWAPYHYGRWVHVNSYWCWAPGPVVRHAVYAPALVAFFGAPGVSVGISVGGPGVGWVALGWGEPLVPWWGRPGFIHRPWWGGWGGPRCINNRVIHHGIAVTVRDIHHYHNTRVRNALVVVDKDRFGHGRIQRRYHREAHLKDWRPIHRAPAVRPAAASYAPTARHGRRPSEKVMRRSTVNFGARDVRKPVTSKRANEVHGWSSRFRSEKRPDRGHWGTFSKGLPETFAPRPQQNPPPDRKHPSTNGDLKMGHRDRTTRPSRVPAINRPPVRHVNPGNREPADGVKPRRRSGDASSTRRTTLKEERSKSVERPSHFQRRSRQRQERTAAPAQRPPAVRPKMNADRRVTPPPAPSGTQIQRAQPRSHRPQRSREVPKVSRNRGDDGIQSPPSRSAEPRQGRINGTYDYRRGPSDGRQLRNGRGTDGQSGHRFQRRFRD